MVPAQKVRASPRISVTKLGEYMVATPRRRRRIIKDQKRPKTYVAAHYEEAVSPRRSFLTPRNTGSGSPDVMLFTMGGTRGQD